MKKSVLIRLVWSLCIMVLVAVFSSCSQNEDVDSIDGFDQDFSQWNQAGFEKWIYDVFIENDPNVTEMYYNKFAPADTRMRNIEKILIHEVDGKTFLSYTFRMYREYDRSLKYLYASLLGDNFVRSACTPGGKIITDESLLEKIFESPGTLLCKRGDGFYEPDMFGKVEINETLQPYYEQIKSIFNEAAEAYGDNLIRFNILNLRRDKEELSDFEYEPIVFDWEYFDEEGFTYPATGDRRKLSTDFYVIQPTGDFVKITHEELMALFDDVPIDDKYYIFFEYSLEPVFSIHNSAFVF